MLFAWFYVPLPAQTPKGVHLAQLDMMSEAPSSAQTPKREATGAGGEGEAAGIRSSGRGQDNYQGWSTFRWATLRPCIDSTSLSLLCPPLLLVMWKMNHQSHFGAHH